MAKIGTNVLMQQPPGEIKKGVRKSHKDFKKYIKTLKGKRISEVSKQLKQLGFKEFDKTDFNEKKQTFWLRLLKTSFEDVNYWLSFKIKNGMIIDTHSELNVWPPRR